MNDLILKYKKDKNKNVLIGKILLVLSIIMAVYGFCTIKMIEKPKPLIIDVCEQIISKSVNGISTVGPFKIKSHECQDIIKVSEILAGSNIEKNFVHKYLEFTDAAFFALTIFIFMLALMFLSSFDGNERIQNYFKLTNDEYWLYRWIQDLFISKKFDTYDDFLNWLGPEKHRYSEREIEVMALNFRLS